MNLFRYPIIGSDGKLMTVIEPPEPSVSKPEADNVVIPESDTVISPRVTLVDLNTVRTLRGCDAQSVLASVADATHPQFLRWVFNLAVDEGDIRRRTLRFWRDEVVDTDMDKGTEPAQAIQRILGRRPRFRRIDIEIAWTLNASTIARFVRAGEIAEQDHHLTRDSLAGFLERRLE